MVDYPAAQDHNVPRSFMFNSNACAAKVASEAALWYNGSLKLVCLEDAETPPKLAHLYRRCTMDTLSPRAQKGKRRSTKRTPFPRTHTPEGHILISTKHGVTITIDKIDVDLAERRWFLTEGYA